MKNLSLKQQDLIERIFLRTIGVGVSVTREQALKFHDEVTRVEQLKPLYPGLYSISTLDRLTSSLAVNQNLMIKIGQTVAITHFGQLVQKSESDLQAIGFTPKEVEEIEDALIEKGLTLDMTVSKLWPALDNVN